MSTKELKKKTKILYVIAGNSAVQCILGITCLILLYCNNGPFNNSLSDVDSRIGDQETSTNNETDNTETQPTPAPLVSGLIFAAPLTAEPSNFSDLANNVTTDQYNTSVTPPTEPSSLNRFFGEINRQVINYAGLNAYKIWFGLYMCVEVFWFFSVIGLGVAAYSVPNNFKYILPWIFVTAGVCACDIGYTIFFVQALISSGNVENMSVDDAGAFEEALILIFVPIFCCKCGIYWIVNIICILKVKSCYVWLKKYYENPFGETMMTATYELKPYVEGDKSDPPKNNNNKRRNHPPQPNGNAKNYPIETNEYPYEPNGYVPEMQNYSSNPLYSPEREKHPPNRPKYASERHHPVERQNYPSSRPKYPSERQRHPSERESYPANQRYPPEPSRHAPNLNDHEPNYPLESRNFGPKYQPRGYNNDGYIDDRDVKKKWSYTPNENFNNPRNEPQKFYRAPPPSYEEEFEDPRQSSHLDEPQLEPVHPVSKPKSKTPGNLKPKAGILKKKSKQPKNLPPEDDDIPENSRVPENKFKKKPQNRPKEDVPNPDRRNTGYYPDREMIIRNPLTEQMNRNYPEERWEPNDPLWETVEEKWEPRVPTFSYIKDLPEKEFSIPRTQLRAT